MIQLKHLDTAEITERDINNLKKESMRCHSMSQNNYMKLSCHRKCKNSSKVFIPFCLQNSTSLFCGKYGCNSTNKKQNEITKFNFQCNFGYFQL